MPLVPDLIPLLALGRRPQFVGPDHLVFAYRCGRHLNGWTLRRHDAALEAASLPRLRMHDLRHVFGS